MLGLGRPKSTIEFSAYGKHPAFNDYFSLNIDSPLANALSAWAEKGTKLKGDQKNNTMIRSFRFWVKGVNKGELVLGVIRDSSDRMGRSYPLLIMGRGSVKDWDKKWHYIFTRFEPVFRSFEDVSASRYDSFKAFEEKLIKIRFPKSLSIHEDERSRLPEIMMAWFRKDQEKGALALPVETLLSNADVYSHPKKDWGVFKKKEAMPGAVFLGGLPENPGLTIYTRPLKAEDFLTLFNISTGGE